MNALVDSIPGFQAIWRRSRSVRINVDEYLIDIGQGPREFLDFTSLCRCGASLDIDDTRLHGNPKRGVPE